MDPLAIHCAAHILFDVQQRQQKLKQDDLQIKFVETTFETLSFYTRQGFSALSPPTNASHSDQMLNVFISILRMQLCKDSTRKTLLGILLRVWESTSETIELITSRQTILDGQLDFMILRAVTDLLASFILLGNHEEFAVGDRLAVQQDGRIEQEGVLINLKAERDGAVVIVGSEIISVDFDKISRCGTYKEDVCAWNFPAEHLNALMRSIDLILSTECHFNILEPTPLSLIFAELQSRSLNVLIPFTHHMLSAQRAFALGPTLVRVMRKYSAYTSEVLRLQTINRNDTITLQPPVGTTSLKATAILSFLKRAVHTNQLQASALLLRQTLTTQPVPQGTIPFVLLSMDGMRLVLT